MTTPTTRLLSSALVAAVLVLLSPVAAHAAFPGRNGPIVSAQYGLISLDASVVPAGGRGWRDPHVSADGKGLFAVLQRDPQAGVASSGIWSMRLDGTDRVQITNSPADASPAPFPDGTRLVVSNGGALWLVPVRPVGGPGSDGRQLLFRDTTLQAANPEVSPDGRRVAFDTTDAGGAKDVWILDLTNLKARRLPGVASNEEMPSWSPNAQQVAFASDRGLNGSWDVMVTGVTAGSPVRNLTAAVDARVDDRAPAWSPDGSLIAFRHGRDTRLKTIVVKTGQWLETFDHVESFDWAVAATATSPGDLPCTIVVKPREGATIRGTAGRDVICGTAASEHIDGGGGNDVIRGGGGDDQLVGGDGDDWLDGGDGDDLLDGGAEGDVLRGGAGRDTVTYAQRTERVLVNLPDPSGFSGTWAAGDVIEGDVIADAEVVLGGAGDDLLFGRSGEDTFDGGPGDDELWADAGNDTLLGGTGDDYLNGGAGDDTLDAGDGDDTLSGVAGADRLLGGAGADSLDGGFGPDTLEGGDDVDTLTYGDRIAPVAVTPGDDVANDGETGEADDVSADVENVTGGSGDDRLHASAKVKQAILTGGPGDDALVGGQFSEDLLQGGPGADVLHVAGDGIADHAECGSGGSEREPIDEAIVDGTDIADDDCERVTKA